MLNVNFCNCNDENFRPRNHHGIVCTKCNPALIQPLLVAEEIKAYRTWHFNIESGFVARNNGRIQSWNNFNTSPPPGFTVGSLHSSNQPWHPPNNLCLQQPYSS